MFTHVVQFNLKFDLPNGETDHLSHDRALIAYRLNFLREEVTELEHALHVGDRVKAFDALLDLAYVTYGTALFLGVNADQWDAGMAAVHRANMAKVRVQCAEESKRGHVLDLYKPDGWVSPEETLKEILS